MRSVLCAALLACTIAGVHAQPRVFVSTTIVEDGDSVNFAALIPEGYDTADPRAILVAWHQWGADQYQVFEDTPFDEEAERRGWITASHLGPSHTHWNAPGAQRHCRIMLDWLSEHYPFHPDSIYMIGGSMGGAAGQVWHNNHCAPGDYVIAATAGGSQILDCQLRQEQYLELDPPDTNRSMRDLFGGLPGVSDSVDFEYHRNSAIHFADTLESMHFNSLTLPIFNTWGSSDLEWLAYGDPAELYATYRTGDPQLTNFFASGIANHGYLVMDAPSICDWLAQFSVTRYPERISVAADEDDDYYYTSVVLDTASWTFGRYGIGQSFERRSLDVSLIRNVRRLTVHFDFPWATFDSLTGVWANEDESVAACTLAFRPLPPVDTVTAHGGGEVDYSYSADDGLLTVVLGANDRYRIRFLPTPVVRAPAAIPSETNLVGAYPNPFNSEITLEIASTQTRLRTIALYDATGRRVMCESVPLVPGLNRVAVRPTGLASGTYFARLEGSPTPPIRVVLLK